MCIKWLVSALCTEMMEVYSKVLSKTLTKSAFQPLGARELVSRPVHKTMLDDTAQ